MYWYSVYLYLYLYLYRCFMSDVHSCFFLSSLQVLQVFLQLFIFFCPVQDTRKIVGPGSEKTIKIIGKSHISFENSEKNHMKIFISLVLPSLVWVQPFLFYINLGGNQDFLFSFFDFWRGRIKMLWIRADIFLSRKAL